MVQQLLNKYEKEAPSTLKKAPAPIDLTDDETTATAATSADPALAGALAAPLGSALPADATSADPLDGDTTTGNQGEAEAEAEAGAEAGAEA